MYTVQAHPSPFTHSLRLEKLSSRFQELVRDWARNLPSKERLHYSWGEFYMVVPFEMIESDTITPAMLSTFTRRFNRLQETRNVEALEAHIATYPFKKWVDHEETLENYIEMMFMLQHFKANVSVELTKPETLAIYVHD